MLNKSYKYRWLIAELVLRDLRLRYRKSVLGFAWTLLNPLLFMTIYTLVFSVYLRIAIPHYALFLLCGLIPYNWLSTALSLGATAVVDGRMYVGKTLFPIEALLIVPVLSTGLNFALSLPMLFALAYAMHVHLGLALIALLPVIAIEWLIIQALVILFATFNVFYRDVQQIVVYFVTILLYISPILYTREMVPRRFGFLITWNPLAPLVTSYQDILYRGLWPDQHALIFAAIFGIVLFGVAYRVFVHYAESFTQYL